MRISLNWLKELVDYDQSVTDLAKRLNDAGLETAQINVYGLPPIVAGMALPDDHLDWEGIVMGEVLEVRKHPNADRLRIAVVDYGEGPQQSVTGAPNIEIGSSGHRVAVAKAGARIVNAYSDDPAPVKVRAAKLRGEHSEIVLCSEKELNLSNAHEGIILLDADAPIGTPLSEVLGDVVIEVEVTPNMARCLNMVGIAREVAALTGGSLKVEEPDWVAKGDPAEGQVEIEIENSKLCARYTASIIRDITIGPSPYWMQHRLNLAGMRPINNIVDITNYVMLEWGQPLHAFDYDTIKPRSEDGPPYILVRNAQVGETLTTLDGVERTLHEEDLLITDGSGPIALAGGMGGEETEVSDHTQNILLESANFDYVTNRRTAQRFKLFSEASNRFSRGLPPQLAEYGLKRASDLMRAYAGGTIAQGFVDNYPSQPEVTVVNLPSGEANRLLGVALSVQEIVELLQPLGFECEIQGDHIRVVVPYHRLDVRLPADLVEEVARMVDYDNLPTRLLEDVLPPQQDNLELEGKLRTKTVLTQLGLTEVINYTLTNPKTVQKFDPQRKEVNPEGFVQLENTLSSERSIMRQSMLPTLLETTESNRRYQNHLAIFEVGHVYLKREQALPEEPSHLGIILSGRRSQPSWFGEEGEMDFFDLKGVVEGLMAGLNIGQSQTRVGTHPSFNPGRCADVFVDNECLGTYGELHPRVVEAFDLKGRVCAAEFVLDALIKHIPNIPTYTPPSRFPAVEQDIALVAEDTISNDEIETLILELGKPLLRRTQLFDVYTGEHIEEGKRSLAYSLTYQAPDRTLTDEEVMEVHQRIQKGLQEQLDADIRGLE